MRKISYLVPVLLVALACLDGCGDKGVEENGDRPPTVDVSGHWEFSCPECEEQGSSYFTFTQTGSSLSASSLCQFLRLFQGSISGNRIVLLFSFEGEGDTLACSGTVSDSTMEGAWSSSEGGSGDWIAQRLVEQISPKECVTELTRVFCCYFEHNESYWIQGFIVDPSHVIEAASISGSHITGTSPFSYGLSPQRPHEWWTDPNIFISQGAPPNFPLYYTVHISFNDGSSTEVMKTVTDWEEAE